MKPQRPRTRPRKPLKAQAREAIRSLAVTLTALIGVLCVAFFMVNNAHAQRGYTLEQLKNEAEALKLESETLNSQITAASALSQIREAEKTSQMTSEKEKIYVTTEDNLVGFNE